MLASANVHKAIELRELLAGLAPGVELLDRPASVPDVEETGTSLLENARLKATAIAEATGHPALADDTGLEVDALGGAPGIYAARYAGPGATYADNVAKLLAELAASGASAESPPRRRACFVTVALLRWPDGNEVAAEGAVAGSIVGAPRARTASATTPCSSPTRATGGRSPR